MRSFWLRLMGLAMVFGGVAECSAVVITFEGVVPAGGFVIPVLPYSEAGFLLTDINTGQENGIFSPSFAETPINTNGSAVLGWNEPLSFALEASSGAPFSISSFEGTNLVRGAPAAGSIDVEGFPVGGGVIGHSFPIVPDTFIVFTFPAAWTNLQRVEFTSAIPESQGPAIDNIRAVVIPEPSTLALLGAGMIGLLAFLAHSRRQATCSARQR